MQAHHENERMKELKQSRNTTSKDCNKFTSWFPPSNTHLPTARAQPFATKQLQKCSTTGLSAVQVSSQRVVAVKRDRGWSLAWKPAPQTESTDWSWALVLLHMSPPPPDHHLALCKLPIVGDTASGAARSSACPPANAPATAAAAAGGDDSIVRLLCARHSRQHAGTPRAKFIAVAIRFVDVAMIPVAGELQKLGTQKGIGLGGGERKAAEELVAKQARADNGFRVSATWANFGKKAFSN
eukprot:1138167-Pelagomonas_calceolata.AAC.8